jgi:chromosome partitioning protein
MQRIVVLNPKGGSGKTTIAINLASYYAIQGLNPVLMDYDPQGSSTRWLKKRAPPLAPIHGIAAYERNARTTRSFLLRTPEDARRQVIDTPAAIESHDMPELTRGADAILVPVLPSDIDIHACSKCIADLLLVAKVKRADNRIAVIANRVKKHTLIYQSLMRFLATLQIPIVATFRDSQNYIRAAELGVGIHEMKPYLVREDLDQWGPLITWLESRGQDGQVARAAAPLMAAPALNGAGQVSASIPNSAPLPAVPAATGAAGPPATPDTDIEEVIVEEVLPAATEVGSDPQ